MYKMTVSSPVGPLTLVSSGDAITRLSFGAAGTSALPCPLLVQAAAELAQYFDGKRRSFTLPLAPVGTAFQQEVWAALLDIPYGETATYGQIAACIGRPKACRAVGLANHSNPLPILIPCHRVVGSDGKLTGYAGGLGIKAALLALEKEHN